MNIPRELIQAIEEDSLVLFIGAGLSYNLKNEKGEELKDWKNLVEKILSHLEEKGDDVKNFQSFMDKKSPIEILELLENEERDKNWRKREVISFVQNFYSLASENDFTLQKNLSKLSNIIITTNYDNAFEKAAFSESRVAYQGKNFELSLLQSVREPVLFKLHGSIAQGNTMILFPSDYNDLYVEDSENSERVRFYLQNLFFNKTILFIGCGMGDFQINNILLGIKKVLGKFNTRNHFIISEKEINDELKKDNYLTRIPINNFPEIDGIIDELLAKKEEIKNRKTPRELELEEKMEITEKQLTITKNIYKKLSLEIYIEGMNFHLTENYEKAIDRYNIVTKINNENYLVWNHWGIALGDLAKTKTGDEVDKLYQEAFEKYAKAIDINPDCYEAYNNWGVDLRKLAQTKIEDVAEKLYKEALKKYKKAIKNKLHKDWTYNNWGNTLGDLAQIKTNNEADKLYKEAFKKFAKAVEINPNLHEAYYNWGNTLMKFAGIKTGKIKTELLVQAIEKIGKAANLGGNCYALAGMCAIMKNKADAFTFLEWSLTNKEVSMEEVKQNEVWQPYCTDPDFLALLSRFE